MRPSLLVLLLCAVPGTASAELLRELPVPPGGGVRVALESGRVEVTRHDEAVCRVEASARGLGAGSVRFDAREESGDVVVASQSASWLAWVNTRPRVAVRVWVPSGIPVTIETRDGDIAVAHVSGAVHARTGRGDVSVLHVDGDVRADTAQGRVVAKDVRGDLDARSVAGRIEVRSVAGDVRAHAGGGAIAIDGVSGEVEARSAGGSIQTTFASQPAGSVETRGGPIRVAFPARSGTALDAQTRGGRVRIEPALALRGDRGHERVVGLINGGGPTLRLRAAGGPIDVHLVEH